MPGELLGEVMMLREGNEEAIEATTRNPCASTAKGCSNGKADHGSHRAALPDGRPERWRHTQSELRRQLNAVSTGTTCSNRVPTRSRRAATQLGSVGDTGQDSQHERDHHRDRLGDDTLARRLQRRIGPARDPDEHGEARLPSVLQFDDKGRATVGWQARAHAVERPESTVHSIKRLMGRGYDELAAGGELKHLPYPVVKRENGRRGATWRR